MTKLFIAAVTGAASVVASRLLWRFVAEHSNTQVHQVRP